MSDQPFRLVTLTTDQGEGDPSTAAIKGVIYSNCPGVQVVDMGNQISCFDVTEAAWFLLGAIPFYPPETVHLVTVAPGPTPIAAKIGGQYVVGPDNGVITLLALHEEVEGVRKLSVPDEIADRTGQIFYGREVYAPAAAALASGAAFESLGEEMEDFVRLDWEEPRVQDTYQLDGRIVRVNRYGALVTNVHCSRLEGQAVERIAAGNGAIYGISQSYSDVPHGQMLALFGNAGYLEIAVNGDRADEKLGLEPGILVKLFLDRKESKGLS